MIWIDGSIGLDYPGLICVTVESVHLDLSTVAIVAGRDIQRMESPRSNGEDIAQLVELLLGAHVNTPVLRLVAFIIETNAATFEKRVV
jgi:hypothetical protein